MAITNWDFVIDALGKIDAKLSTLTDLSIQSTGRLEAHDEQLRNIKESVSALVDMRKELKELSSKVEKHDFWIRAVQALFSALIISGVLGLVALVFQLLTHGQPIINWLLTGTPTP